MARFVISALMLGLLLAPQARPVVAADEVAPVPAALPAPSVLSVECPPPAPESGAPATSEGAPVVCLTVQSGGGEDPCAPDATGAVPEMCQSQPIPIDLPVGGDACWITPDGSTNCARTDGGPELSFGRHFAIAAVSLSGARYEFYGAQMSFGSDGTFSASIGCNQIGGSVLIQEDGSFTVSELRSTKMYCDDLAAAESALIEILNGGTLTFAQGDTGLVAQNAVGSIELIEAMYDALPTDGDVRAVNFAAGESSGLNALLVALVVLGIPTLVGAAGISTGLSRRS